ncbi:Lipopolysaccharide biosynthesis protein WzxC [Castellaniella defragrans]
MQFKSKVFSAVRWTGFTSLSRAGLQFLQLVILARILSPSDYGLMAIVTIALGFTNVLADFGVNSAYVQRQEVTEKERSSLYWLNIALSLVLTIAVIILSPLVAVIMHDPRLTALLIASANVLWISALGQQLRMSAEKILDFKPVAAVEVSAALLGFLTAVILAKNQWGVWALVVGSLVNVSTSTLGAWLFMSRGWRPIANFSWREVKPFLHFGGAVVANNLVSQLGTSMDVLIGGRTLNTAGLGLYSVPRNLCLQVQFVINPIVTRIGFPLISKLQSDKRALRNIYLQTINMTASVNAPIYLGVAFFTSDIVNLVLGNQWSGAIDLMRVLAIWAFFRSILSPLGSLLLGIGRADLNLKWSLGLVLLYVPSLAVGAYFGAIGLAYAMLGAMVLMYGPSWRLIVFPACGAKFTEYSVCALKPFVLAAISVCVSHIISSEILAHPLPRLIIGALIASILYWIISCKLNPSWVSNMKHLVGTT